MKRLLRICLCLLTVISVVALVACTPSDISGDTKPRGQEQNNADTQPSTHPKATEPVTLSYDVKLIRTGRDDSITYPQIQLLTLAETTKVTADLKALHSQYKNEPMTPGTGAEELSYDEAYFENKSLALIKTTIPMGETLTTSQVTYDGEMLKVILQRPAVPVGTTSLSAFGYWCIFVEINEKLQNTTKVSVEIVSASTND